MKKFMSNLLKIIVISVSFILSSCSLSTDELAKKVESNMKETWASEGITGIEIKSFILTHKSGNEYSGLLETIEDDESFKYSVDVIYDGNYFQWEIVE